MTPLFNRLKLDLKPSTASYRVRSLLTNRSMHRSACMVEQNPSLSQDAICIELRPSQQHALLIGALSGLSLTSCLVSQLPWYFCVIAALWITGSVLHWRYKPQHIHSIIDSNEGWLLHAPQGLTPVRYQHTNYCTEKLIVMTFITQTGNRRRVFVWRDAVTPAAFSWLSARMTLGEADAPVQNVATSGPKDVFSFSSRLTC